MNKLFIAFRNASKPVASGELSVLLIGTADAVGARWHLEAHTRTKPTEMGIWTIRKAWGHTIQSGILWETREPSAEQIAAAE